MKTWLFLFGILISSHGNAEIFKCKDSSNKISYQNNPCSSTAVGKVRKDADIPEEDRLKAQERIDSVFERERQQKAAEEKERLARHEKAKELLLQKEAKAIENRKLQLLERQAISSEKSAIEANRARLAAERSQQENQNKQLRCRPDYAGGLICN